MKKPFVWIVDDDDIYQYTITKTLEMENLTGEIKVFSDGETALTTLLNEKQNVENLPDYILLDLNMPIMDGWQFLEEYSSITFEKTIKLFIVSSSVNEVDKNKAKQYTTVKDYVIKPVDLDALRQLLTAS